MVCVVDDPAYIEVRNIFYVILAVVVIGFPFLILGFLYRVHTNLKAHDHGFRKTFGILYEMYTPSAYWWEVMIICRRIITIGLTVALSTSRALQFSWQAVFLACSLFATLYFRPYPLQIQNTAESIALLTLTVVVTILVPTEQPLTQFQSYGLQALAYLVLILLICWIIRNRYLKKCVPRKSGQKLPEGVVSHDGNTNYPFSAESSMDGNDELLASMAGGGRRGMGGPGAAAVLMAARAINGTDTISNRHGGQALMAGGGIMSVNGSRQTTPVHEPRRLGKHNRMNSKGGAAGLGVSTNGLGTGQMLSPTAEVNPHVFMFRSATGDGLAMTGHSSQVADHKDESPNGSGGSSAEEKHGGPKPGLTVAVSNVRPIRRVGASSRATGAINGAHPDNKTDIPRSDSPDSANIFANRPTDALAARARDPIPIVNSHTPVMAMDGSAANPEAFETVPEVISSPPPNSEPVVLTSDDPFIAGTRLSPSHAAPPLPPISTAHDGTGSGSTPPPGMIAAPISGTSSMRAAQIQQSLIAAAAGPITTAAAGAAGSGGNQQQQSINSGTGSFILKPRLSSSSPLIQSFHRLSPHPANGDSPASTAGAAGGPPLSLGGAFAPLPPLPASPTANAQSGAQSGGGQSGTATQRSLVGANLAPPPPTINPQALITSAPESGGISGRRRLDASPSGTSPHSAHSLTLPGVITTPGQTTRASPPAAPPLSLSGVAPIGGDLNSGNAVPLLGLGMAAGTDTPPTYITPRLSHMGTPGSHSAPLPPIQPSPFQVSQAAHIRKPSGHQLGARDSMFTADTNSPLRRSIAVQIHTLAPSASTGSLGGTGSGGGAAAAAASGTPKLVNRDLTSAAAVQAATPSPPQQQLTVNVIPNSGTNSPATGSTPALKPAQPPQQPPPPPDPHEQA